MTLGALGEFRSMKDALKHGSDCGGEMWTLEDREITIAQKHYAEADKDTSSSFYITRSAVGSSTDGVRVASIHPSIPSGE